MNLEQIGQLTTFLYDRCPKMDHHNLALIRGDRKNPALLAPAVMGSSPLFVLLFYWSCRRLPHDLFEAARLDGGSAWQVWWRVALPIALPTAAAVAMLAFVFYWSDFVSPLLYLKSQSLYTLPVGVQQLQQLDRTNWPLLMSGAVLMTLPPVLIFLVVQRYFLRDAQWLR